MKQSETIANLSVAMNAFQTALQGVIKNSKNPFYDSKYADLAAIWETIREPLTANGLYVIQGGVDEHIQNVISLETKIVHISGEWMSSVMYFDLVKDTKNGLVLKNDPQSAGSAITYARRYGLAAMLGIHQEDADGNTHATKAKPESELSVTLEKLHASQTKLFKDGAFTADEIKKFNKEYLGTDNTMACKTIAKANSGSIKFEVWAKQRICANLAETDMPQENHRKHYLAMDEHLGVDNAYACDDIDRLERTILDLQDRVELKGATK